MTKTFLNRELSLELLPSPRSEPSEESPTILVIDDDEEFLEEVGDLLAACGYAVSTSSDNEHAIDKMHEVNPDILVIDLKMMPKSGFQIADETKNFPEWKNLIIIGMSAFFLEKEHRRLMEICGIRSFVPKPFKPANLVARIESELSNSG